MCLDSVLGGQRNINTGNKMGEENYFGRFNNVKTENDMLNLARNLPIGHFKALVKSVGIVIEEFANLTNKMPDPSKCDQLPEVDLSNEIRKSDYGKCKGCGSYRCQNHSDDIHLPPPNQGEKVMKV